MSPVTRVITRNPTRLSTPTCEPPASVPVDDTDAAIPAA